MITATHSRKARYDHGPCGLCRAPMRIGQRIARVGRGGSWLHAACFVQRYRTTTDQRSTT